NRIHLSAFQIAPEVIVLRFIKQVVDRRSRRGGRHAPTVHYQCYSGARPCRHMESRSAYRVECSWPRRIAQGRGCSTDGGRRLDLDNSCVLATPVEITLTWAPERLPNRASSAFQ